MKVRQRAHRRQLLGPARPASAAAAPCRWSSCGCESAPQASRAARSARSLLAAQLVGARCAAHFLPRAWPAMLSRSAAISLSRRLSASAADSNRSRASPALHAQIFLLVARLAHLRVQPLGFALQRGQALFALRVWLRALPASVSRCMAWRRLASSCRSAVKTSSAAARASCCRASTFCRNAVASPAAVSRKLCCCVALLGNAAQLRACLLQLRAGRGDPRFQAR